MRSLVKRSGLERGRVLEDVGQAVARVGAVVDVCARRHLVPRELEGADGPARADPRRRVQAQRLVGDHVEVRELAVEGGRVGGLAAEHAVELVAQALARLGRAGELDRAGT